LNEEKVIPFKPESDKPEGKEIVIAECCGTCLYWTGNRDDHEQNPVALCKGLPPFIVPISAVPEPTKLLTTQQETGKVPLNMQLITAYPKMPYLSPGCALYTPWAAVKEAMELNALFSKAALFPETLTEEEIETLAKLKEMNQPRGTENGTTGTSDEPGAEE
jgi:hypothetical protein